MARKSSTFEITLSLYHSPHLVQNGDYQVEMKRWNVTENEIPLSPPLGRGRANTIPNLWRIKNLLLQAVVVNTDQKDRTSQSRDPFQEREKAPKIAS